MKNLILLMLLLPLSCTATNQALSDNAIPITQVELAAKDIVAALRAADIDGDGRVPTNISEAIVFFTTLSNLVFIRQSEELGNASPEDNKDQ